MSKRSSTRWCVPCLVLFLAIPLGAQEILTQVRDSQLRVGIVSADNHPFVYRKDGEWTGYEVTLARQIAEELNAGLAIVAFNDRDQLRGALLDGRIHVAFSKLFRSLANGEIAFQSSPVGVLNLALVINRTSYSRMRTKGDLEGDLEQGRVPIATVGEETFVRRVTESYPNADLTVFDDYTALWSAVEAGEAVAIALDEAAANRYFLEYPERGLQLRVLPMTATVTVVALLPWQDDFFAEWVNILIEGQGDPAAMETMEAVYTIE